MNQATFLRNIVINLAGLDDCCRTLGVNWRDFLQNYDSHLRCLAYPLLFDVRNTIPGEPDLREASAVGFLQVEQRGLSPTEETLVGYGVASRRCGGDH